MAANKLQAFWNHPAGPKTIHFWAPTCKWVISIANIADFSKPPEKISYPQQLEKLEPFQRQHCDGWDRLVSTIAKTQFGFKFSVESDAPTEGYPAQVAVLGAVFVLIFLSWCRL